MPVALWSTRNLRQVQISLPPLRIILSIFLSVIWTRIWGWRGIRPIYLVKTGCRTARRATSLPAHTELTIPVADQAPYGNPIWRPYVQVRLRKFGRHDLKEMAIHDFGVAWIPSTYIEKEPASGQLVRARIQHAISLSKSGFIAISSTPNNGLKVFGRRCNMGQIAIAYGWESHANFASTMSVMILDAPTMSL